MLKRDVFVPATVQDVTVLDPGEVCTVTLRLPDRVELDGRTYSLADHMRPGNAFLAKPFGARTGRWRRRMYTRSNSSDQSPLLLETIINHTHEVRADTSVWWQSEQVQALRAAGGTVDVRLSIAPEDGRLILFENSPTCEPANLRLEPDGVWESMRVAAVALSTGLTPFLAYLRYMSARQFGRSAASPGCHLALVVSVRNPRQLMAHDELLALGRIFPDNFLYYPVLTREWPADWPYGTGRIIRAVEGQGTAPRIDLGRLLAVVPDLGSRHVRFCGNLRARNELRAGLEQAGLPVPSFRAEVW